MYFCSVDCSTKKGPPVGNIACKGKRDPFFYTLLYRYTIVNKAVTLTNSYHQLHNTTFRLGM